MFLIMLYVQAVAMHAYGYVSICVEQSKCAFIMVTIYENHNYQSLSRINVNFLGIRLILIPHMKGFNIIIVKQQKTFSTLLPYLL